MRIDFPLPPDNLKFEIKARSLSHQFNHKHLNIMGTIHYQYTKGWPVISSQSDFSTILFSYPQSCLVLTLILWQNHQDEITSNAK